MSTPGADGRDEFGEQGTQRRLMFWNQVHFIRQELGRAHGLGLILLLAGPLLAFAAIALLLQGPR